VLTATDTEEPPPPETKVVRLVRGNTALQVQVNAEREEENEELFVRAMSDRAARMGQLRLVGDAGDD
jgi:hypothetical protein